MIPPDCILLGKISKVHGFEGAVTVKTELNLSEDIPAGEPVFLEIEGRPVPFFVEDNYRSRPGILTIKFEDYDSSDRVKEFVGCSVFIPSDSDIKKIDTDGINIISYKVFSDTGKIVGTISDIIYNPGQVLLELTSGTGKKILVPFHDDLVREIDDNRQIIKMVFPEGLMEIN
jgi:16S rRNA processing protein RimM